MFAPLKLKSVLAENANANQGDVLAIKTLLRKLGLYEAPDWGVTNFPDSELFQAIRAFQDRAGLKIDGRMKPDGETETALHKAARMLQGLGRHGDTVLAHISPAEARLLKAKGGAGTVNPRTGLLEFYVAGKKEGSYIWRTQGDGKVRPSHAGRNGQTFSWDDPPDGGHPGEAPNCRCSAEEVKEKDKCKRLKVQLLSAEQAAKEAQERARKADAEFEKQLAEANQLWEEIAGKLIQLGLENLIPLIKAANRLRKELRGLLDSSSSIFKIFDLLDALEKAEQGAEKALQGRKFEEETRDKLLEKGEEIRKEMDRLGC